MTFFKWVVHLLYTLTSLAYISELPTPKTRGPFVEVVGVEVRNASVRSPYSTTCRETLSWNTLLRQIHGHVVCSSSLNVLEHCACICTLYDEGRRKKVDRLFHHVCGMFSLKIVDIMDAV